jgi:hypothetical protein
MEYWATLGAQARSTTRRAGTFFTGLHRENGDYFHKGGVRLGATVGEVVKKGAGGTVGLVGAEGF